MKKKLLAAVMVLCLGMMGCEVVPANTVFSADDLEGKVIACQIGSTGYIYAGEIKNAEVMGFDKGADAIAALVAGDADAVIIDDEPAKVFVAENDALRILDEPYAEEEYAVIFQKGNSLGAELDEALEEMEKDGTLDGIIMHWIGDNADHVSYTPDASIKRSGTLVMATNATFPPYEYVEEGQIIGIDADMMQAVCDRLGKELVIEDMKFDEIMPAVSSGKADVGAAAITVSNDRMEQVDFTHSYATATQVIVVRNQ